VEIKVDDLSGPEIEKFLEEHLSDMRVMCPSESKHALDLEGLRQPDITFWTVWDGAVLVACGAIKKLDAENAEIKSMRTSASYRGKGIASRLLWHMLAEAKTRGDRRLSLETGSMPYFGPARRLYEKFGFDYCPPFADYREEPNSVFMTLLLH
jgi:putative acetyltransferase